MTKEPLVATHPRLEVGYGNTVTHTSVLSLGLMGSISCLWQGTLQIDQPLKYHLKYDHWHAVW